MPDLVAGQQYDLCAQKTNNNYKSLVFVKLTESALRCIEECITYKGNALSKLSIKFQNNNGVVTLPGKNGSRAYNFTLSNMKSDAPQGSFECLQQTDKYLKSIGCICIRLQINANENSYAEMKIKVVESEQKQKQLCTKQIKPNGSRLEVKFKHPVLDVCYVKNSLNPPKMIMKKMFADNEELSRQPIRKRIIHILAVRPYKMPEILLRLKSEGLNENDQKRIASILTQVGTSKGSSYMLDNHFWNEVQDNWKYYSEEELEKIQKRKKHFLNSTMQHQAFSKQKHTVPSLNDLKPFPRKQKLSHCGITENSIKDDIVTYSSMEAKGKCNSQDSSQSLCSKPITLESSLNGPIPHTKKQKVSHCSYTENNNKVANNTYSFIEANGKNCSQYLTQPSHIKVKSDFIKKKEQFLNPNQQLKSSEVNENFSVQDELIYPPLNSDYQLYIGKQYDTIESRKQQALFIADFNAQYEEYLQLHSNLKCVFEQLACLEAYLQTIKEGSVEYKKFKWKIYNVCQAYQQDQYYMDTLKKFKFLHSKLSHIKRLILEYDCVSQLKS